MAGTYVAVKVHPLTEEKIQEYIEKNQIPLEYPEDEDRRHCTLIYAPNDDFVKAYKEESCNPLLKFWAVPDKFELFPTQKGPKCLVLRIVCPELVKRHTDMVKAYGARVTFPDYKPHVTFTYAVPEGFSVDTIPYFSAPLILTDEYCDPLDENW